MAKIEDFGDRIAGAAKDRWRDYARRLTAAGLEDAQTAPLSRLFPEPAYEKLIQDGAEPWSVAFVRAVREAIPRRPRDHRLRGWAQQVAVLRNFAGNVISGTVDRTGIERALERPGFSRLRQQILSSVELYLAIGHSQSLKDLRLSEVAYGIFEGRVCNPPYRRWEVSPVSSGRTSMPKVIAHGQSRQEAISDLQRVLGAQSPQTKAPRQTRFSLYRRRDRDDVFIGKKIGRHHLDLASFATLPEAKSYLRDHVADLEARLERLKDTPSERRAANLDRQGPDWRDGQSVTPERFLSVFGFRGVQFGNYVEGVRRQQDLDDAFDALMDLSDVLGRDPRSLSLNGTLALAFGARGRGGIGAGAAHFEPAEIVINLTKTRGPGSLAHEWFHALDNHVARLCSAPLGYASALGSGEIAPGSDAGREFQILSRFLSSHPMKQRSGQLDLLRGSAYWGLPLELAARAFEAHIALRLTAQGRSNDYLVNVVDEEVFEAEAALRGQPHGRYPYPREGELADISRRFDTLFASTGITRILPADSPEACRLQEPVAMTGTEPSVPQEPSP